MKITPLESWIRRRTGNGKERLTRRTIEIYQLSKLQETIGWARKKSLFYRGHLAGFAEGTVSCLEELARLPFTTAEDVRCNPLRFLCVSQSEINRVVTLPTSGTTGDPKRIHFTPHDQELTVDFFCHGMSTLAGPGDRVLILFPGELPGSVGDLLAKSLDLLGAAGIPHGPAKDIQHTLDVMVREKVDTLAGIPVQVLALARLGGGRAAPRNVLLSADHVPQASSRELGNLWGCEVFTHYGMTEMGYGGGVECQAHFGYHMREADLFFEIIDPATGTPVKAGEPGEVVFTTLSRRGMPLIRYRTGDISRFIAEKCPCGTVLKSMARVTGRIAGQARLGSGTTLSMADLDEALFPLAGLLDFRALLTSEKGRDRLHVEIHSMAPKGEGMVGRACRAINAIPVVQAACAEGALVVSAAARGGDHLAESWRGKRVIVDQRHSRTAGPPLVRG